MEDFGLPENQAAADLPVGEMEVMLEQAVDLTFLRIGHSVNGLAAIAGQDFLVNQPADVEILHPGVAEVPSGFIVEKLSDGFFGESRLHVSKRDGFACSIFALFLQPSFVCQAIHLI